ncbi:MAG: twitching motility protein PilT [Lachnospiraceae bacterium]|nr:twitching motility protein PilT [Lachnospiraceae bacterium]
MIRMITGKNGKGKSKVLLEKVNEEVKTVLGNVVYIDTTTKHMYELNNKIRLINASEYMLDTSDKFLGFLSGIISQDHDLQQMYFDNFLKLANISISEIEGVVKELELLSDKFGVDIYISVSTSDGDIPASLEDKVLIAL